MKVRNMKSLSLFVFFFTLAREKNKNKKTKNKKQLKTHCIESRLLLHQEAYCLQVCASLFSPKMLQAGAVKGLM